MKDRYVLIITLVALGALAIVLSLVF